MNANRPSPQINSIFSILLFRIGLFILLLFLLKSEKYLSSAFVLVAIAVIELSALWSKHGLKNLNLIYTIKPSRLFPEEESFAQILIKNNKKTPCNLIWGQQMPESFEVSLVNAKSEEPGYIGSGLYLRGNASKCIDFRFKVLQRGYFELPETRIQSIDVFGLFYRDIFFNEKNSLIVYPRLKSTEELGLIISDFSGLNRNDRPFMLDPIMISGLREYSYDTPSKLINWKASAQKDILLSKIIESSSNLKLMIAVDTNSILNSLAPNAAELFEEALSIAASIAVLADLKRIPCGFVGDFCEKGRPELAIISINRADDQGMQILESLARAEFKVKKDLNELFRLDSRILPWGTTLLVIGEKTELKLPPGVSRATYLIVSEVTVLGGESDAL